MAFRLLQYGDSGVGKSVRASDAAQFGPVEIHNFDAQSNLQRYLAHANPGRLSQIRVISYSGKSNVAKIDSFVSRIRDLVKLNETGKKPDIATLVIDSYTAFETYYVEYLTGKYKPSPTAFGSPRTEFDVGTEECIIPGSMDYSVLSVAMKKETDRWKNAGINIIVNAHEKDPLESRNVIIKQGTVKAAGQLRDFLPAEFDEVHRLFIDGNTGAHRVQAKPTRLYLAKTALDKVPGNGVLSTNSLDIFSDIAFKLDVSTTNKEK